jgi:hypothetical protein
MLVQSQLASLQSEYKNLQAKDGTTSILMYLAIFVAVIFVVSTLYIILMVLGKGKKKKVEEAPLY